MKQILWTAAAVLFAMPNAQAATVMETREPSGEISVITIEGTRARLQTAPDNYVLIDLARQKFYAVDLGAGEAIDLSLPSEPVAPTPGFAPRAQLQDQGPGPTIAGYPTRHYRIVAEGQTCSDTFLSVEALRDGEMHPFIEGFRALYARQRAGANIGETEATPCDDAHDAAWSRYPDLGVPLRTEDPSGNLRQEVVRFRTQVSIEGELLSLPSGVTPITLREFLLQRMQAAPASYGNE